MYPVPVAGCYDRSLPSCAPQWRHRCTHGPADSWWTGTLRGRQAFQSPFFQLTAPYDLELTMQLLRVLPALILFIVPAPAQIPDALTALNDCFRQAYADARKRVLAADGPLM